MDCETARQLLPFARPLGVELDTTEADALAAHLADCPECQNLRQAEQAVDARIGQAMRAVPLPANLRERILQRVDIQHRSAARPRILRMGLSLAASVLLAVTGWYFWSHSLTRVDLEGMNPEHVGYLPGSVEQIEEAFAERKIAVEMPPGFNYDLLTFWGTTKRWGRDVPFVHLQSRGAAFARIYVLDGDQFDLDYLAAHPMAPSSPVMTLNWLGRSPSGRFGYIVEYNSRSLEPFRNGRTLPPT